MTDAPTQPPSPAQRILDVIDALAPKPTVDEKGICHCCNEYIREERDHDNTCRSANFRDEIETTLATVRAALKEMEEDYRERRERTLGTLRSADLRAERAEQKLNYLRDHLSDAMRVRKLAGGGEARDIHNQAIDTCLEVLKEGFE